MWSWEPPILISSVDPGGRTWEWPKGIPGAPEVLPRAAGAHGDQGTKVPRAEPHRPCPLADRSAHAEDATPDEPPDAAPRDGMGGKGATRLTVVKTDDRSPRRRRRRASPRDRQHPAAERAEGRKR